MILLEVEGRNMSEESQSEYKLDGPPVTQDELSKRIGERIQEISKERQRLAHSGLLKDTQGLNVWTDEGLKQLLEIQGKIHSNKGAISRADVREQISHRTKEFLRTGRKTISLDSEPGLRELYGLLKNPDNRVPTYEEKVAREMAQKAEETPAEIEVPTEIPKTPFFNKLKNIGKTISEFLRAPNPNREAERIRRFEAQSHEQLQTTFRETGRKLRGFSGFLRGAAFGAFTLGSGFGIGYGLGGGPEAAAYGAGLGAGLGGIGGGITGGVVDRIMHPIKKRPQARPSGVPAPTPESVGR